MTSPYLEISRETLERSQAALLSYIRQINRTLGNDSVVGQARQLIQIGLNDNKRALAEIEMKLQEHLD
jgi:hypothetical protein